MNSVLMGLAGNIAITVGGIMIGIMIMFLILGVANGYGASKGEVFVTVIGLVLVLVGFVMRSMAPEKDFRVQFGNTEETIVEETVASPMEEIAVTEVTEITVPYTGHTQAAEHGTNGGWA